MKTRNKTHTFKNGKIAKNRVVVPPMASQTADENGNVTEKTIQHYKNLAQSGAGIIFVEYSYIHKSGKGEKNQLGVDTNDKVSSLSEISKVIHESGALAGFQIVHVGGKADSAISGMPLLGASPIRVPVKDRNLAVPTEMTESQVETYIDWYAEAAERVSVAGFDIVELHAAHGYGLNQWLSPITNKRSDQFGGGVSKRAEIIFRIIRKIKNQVPSLLVGIRLPAQDHYPEGLSVEDMQWVVQELEKLGVDIIDVSSGIGGWRRPEGRNGEGYLLDDAQALKKHLNLPVIGVGGIESGDFIDHIIENNIVDFAAVGRAILKDPQTWRLQHLQNSN